VKSEPQNFPKFQISHSKFQATASPTHPDPNQNVNSSFECPNDGDNHAIGAERICEHC